MQFCLSANHASNLAEVADAAATSMLIASIRRSSAGIRAPDSRLLVLPEKAAQPRQRKPAGARQRQAPTAFSNGRTLRGTLGQAGSEAALTSVVRPSCGLLAEAMGIGTRRAHPDFVSSVPPYSVPGSESPGCPVLRHYSPKTMEAYIGWVRRCVVFHDQRHPRSLGAREVSVFLSISLGALGRSPPAP